jgi:nitrous oxidase accessory protein
MRHLLALGAAFAFGGAASAVDPPAGDPASVSPVQAMIARAAPGDTVEIGPGVYHGRLRIDKPIRLIGRGRPTLDAGGRGDVVEIVAENVTLMGFVVRGTGIDLDGENVGVRVLAAGVTVEDNELADVLFGIDCKAAPRCVIRGNTIGGKKLDIARRGDGIRLWRSDGALIEGNTIIDGRDAILWYSAGVTVRNNVCRRCRYGFHLMYSNTVTIEGNTLEDNSVGVYFMYSTGMTLRDNRILHNRGPSGYGIGLKDTDGFVVEDNLIAGNRVGVYLDNSPVVRTLVTRIAHNTLATNDIGMSFLPSVKGNTLTENSFLDNFEQVAVLGRGELTDNEFEVGGRGNFWSDYAGYDLDGNGVGESPYEARKLFENMVDREPKLRLWLFSPAQEAIEFMARAVPAVQPEPKFEDASPLVRPAGRRALADATSESGALAWIAGALLGTAGTMLAIAFAPGLIERRAIRRRAGVSRVEGVLS